MLPAERQLIIESDCRTFTCLGERSTEVDGARIVDLSIFSCRSTLPGSCRWEEEKRRWLLLKLDLSAVVVGHYRNNFRLGEAMM